MERKKEAIGTILAIVTAIISGFSIFANKFFIVNLDATVFTAIRAIIIGVAFLVLSFIFGSWKLKENKKINWIYLLIIGIIGGGFAFLLFFNGLKLTSAGRAGFFHKTLPLYVTVLAFFFLKEKINIKQTMALLLMIVGTLVMVSSQIPFGEMWLNPQTGDLLVIGATILWAIENVVAKKAMIKGEHNFVVSFARMFFGGVVLFGIALITNKIGILVELSSIQWMYILISTLMLFGYVLTYYWAIRYINVSKAASILLISPVITLIAGMFLLGEPAPLLQLIGSAIILIGAYFIINVRSEFVRI